MAVRSKMNDAELIIILDTLEHDSVSYNAEFMLENEETLKRYNKEPYGDEEAGSSSVVASDVQDLVNADMVSLVRTFLGSGDVMVFEAQDDSKEAKDEAKAKTKYINWLALHRPNSYKIIHDWLKDAETQKMGVLHYYMDEIKDTREMVYKNLNSVEMTAFFESLKEKDDLISKIEISGKNELEGGRFDVTARITTEYKDIKIDNIPTEDFLLSRNASSIADAAMIGHVSFPTRSELVQSGMTEKAVAKFATAASDSSAGASGNANGDNYNTYTSDMKDIRFRDQGGNLEDPAAYGEWANQTVRMVTMYAKVDVDLDGIAERRRIVKIGQTITENEAYDHVPYAVTSAIVEPHKAIGNSRASLVVEDQSVNTELDRLMLNNAWNVGEPQYVVGDAINIDDFLDPEADRMIRMQPNSTMRPTEAVAPLVAPFIGQELMLIGQNRDQQQAARTGTILDSQGLEADQLNSETATRFNGIEKAAEGKIELVARNHAEIGFRKLYEGLDWTTNRYQDKEQKFRIAGNAYNVTPTDWQYPAMAVSQVGLGAGNGQKTVQQMVGVLAIQDQEKMSQSLLTDDQKRYNAIDKMMQGLGLRTSEYFNNPDIPEEMLMASYQKAIQVVQLQGQQLEQMSQNPLADAERVRAEGQIAIQQEKNTTELLKAEGKLRLDELALRQKNAFHESDKTYDYTKLELENSVDIPGEGQGQ